MTRQRSSPRWAEAFTRAHGCWAEILRHLSQRWDPALYAEVCRANVGGDWTLVLPLVDDAVKRKAFSEATALIDEGLRSRLRLEESDRWDPRAKLLIRHEPIHSGNDRDPKIAKLLRHWRKVASALGQLDLAAALALQIVALSDVDNGDVMLEGFAAIPPQFSATREALFADWRGLVVEWTLGTWRGSSLVPCSNWILTLVDAARAGTHAAVDFRAAVRTSLEEALTLPAAGPNPGWVPHPTSLSTLAVLTRDIDATAPTMKGSAPRLWKLLQAQEPEQRDRLATTRRTWCKRLEGASLVPEVEAFWRKHAVRFVPDPGVAGGDYSQPADWVAAVAEINPTAARDLLAAWTSRHHLKRNLWRDLAVRGIVSPARVRPGGPATDTRR